MHYKANDVDMLMLYDFLVSCKLLFVSRICFCFSLSCDVTCSDRLPVLKLMKLQWVLHT